MKIRAHRQALAAFPLPAVAEWIPAAYRVDDGRPEADMLCAVPRLVTTPLPERCVLQPLDAGDPRW